MANEAFSLARKYEDFGMMLSLKVSSKDFDEFFESSVADFGREFAMIAFKWLEERGEINLLLCGKQVFACRELNGVREVGQLTKSRSANVQHFLREYFACRKDRNNLSWMLELSTGKYGEAAKHLCSQATAIGVPGKRASLSNTRLLLSVAKLCLHASVRKATTAETRDTATPPVDQSLRAVADNIDRRLYLVRAQHRLGSSANEPMEEAFDAILPASVLVQRFLDEAPVESNALSENAVLALETLSCSDLPAHTARELKDYVWRRCIERQGHVWMPLSGARGMSDSELRQKIEGTALYSAAKAVHFGTHDATDLIDRGVLDIAEFLSSGHLPQLCRLVLTTVRLAEEPMSGPILAG
jgi:Non-repetitive/WGA-negative nucleoporin C-terminal